MGDENTGTYLVVVASLVLVHEGVGEGGQMVVLPVQTVAGSRGRGMGRDQKVVVEGVGGHWLYHSLAHFAPHPVLASQWSLCGLDHHFGQQLFGPLWPLLADHWSFGKTKVERIPIVSLLPTLSFSCELDHQLCVCVCVRVCVCVCVVCVCIL